MAQSEHQPLIVGHRGASRDAPENTLSAFHLAWERGADGIEGDFRLTKDGVVVCVHDADMKRTAGSKLVVSKSTHAELATLDVGSWKAEKYKDERVPTLAEVVETIPEGKFLLLEVKCGPEIVPVLARELKGRDEQVRIICFTAAVISATREQMPGFQAYWLASYKRGKPTDDTILDTIRKTKAHGLGSQAHERVDEALVKRLRAEKLAFHVWTINDMDMAKRFRSLGVDSITTDRPGWLRESLR